MDQEIELNIQNDEVEMELNTQDDGVGIDLENSETIVATNYNNLENKPKVNNVELSGNKTLDELGIQSKVAGKGLSSNDYTNEDKSKLDGIEENANNYVLPTDVVKDSNYVHTDNNYSTTDKNKLAGIEPNANYYVLPTDVVKDNNYTHTDNNYTTNDKNKLAGIDMGSKQDTINDLDVIRSGASLGATSLQSVPNTYKTKTENDNLYQSKGNYALESDIPTKTSDLENDSNFVTNTNYGTTSKAGVIKAANGVNINSSTGTISARTYTSDEYNSLGQYVFVGKGTLENVLAAKGYLTEHQDISGKQDKSTLETDVKTFINAEYIQTLFTNAEGVEF